MSYGSLKCQSPYVIRLGVVDCSRRISDLTPVIRGLLTSGILRVCVQPRFLVMKGEEGSPRSVS